MLSFYERLSFVWPVLICKVSTFKKVQNAPWSDCPNKIVFSDRLNREYGNSAFRTIPNNRRSYHHCNSVLKLNTSNCIWDIPFIVLFLYFIIMQRELIAKIILVYFPLSHLYILLDCTCYVHRYDDKGF